MKIFINIMGLSFDIIGCSLIFCESLKMAVHYNKDGPHAYVAVSRNNWFWRYCRPIGLILLIIGFFFQIIAILICV